MNSRWTIPMVGVTMLAAALMLSGCSVVEFFAPGPPSPRPKVETPIPVPSDWSTPESTPTPTPAPSPSGSFPPPPEDQTDEETAIRQAWEAYWNAFDYALRNPGKGLEQLSQTTSGEEKDISASIVQDWREANVVPQGGYEFRSIDVQYIQGDSATIEYCVDGSDLRPVDQDTGEPFEGNMVATLQETATLRRDETGTWRVDLVRNEEKAC